MKRLIIIPLLVGVVTLFSGNAQAGFINPADDPSAAPFTCDFTNSQNQHQWQFDYDMPQLVLSETIHSTSQDPVLMSGETDSDPIFTVIKTITNTSGVDWTGYILTLSGGAMPTFVLGSAGSGGGKLKNVAYIDPETIVFYGPNPVKHGEVLTLQFDINIPTAGLFDFTLTQNPVPEPVSIVLFGIGGLGLLCRRRVPARGGLK